MGSEMCIRDRPVLVEGRRPAGYYLKARTREPQVSLFEEEFVPLEFNTIREQVKNWRERGYPIIVKNLFRQEFMKLQQMF